MFLRSMRMEQRNASGNSGKHGSYPREDRALKAAAQMMGEELLALMGLKGKIKRTLPTEQVQLKTEDFFEDFNYEMEDGKILHLEFESDSITKDDLRRFRVYEAILSYQYKREVTTCVLCTADTRKPMEQLVNGMSCYHVRVVCLKDWDADTLIRDLEEKQKIKRLEREELLKVILTPLMSGKLPQSERIRRSLFLLRGEQENQEKSELLKMQAVLYTLAEKFVQKEELEKVKEEFYMTRLGQMIFDDGVKKGMEKGMEKGRESGLELAKQILRLAGENVPVQEIARRLSATEEEVRQILN